MDAFDNGFLTHIGHPENIVNQNRSGCFLENVTVPHYFDFQCTEGS